MNEPAIRSPALPPSLPDGEPVRRTFDLPTRGPQARLGALEFGDPTRALDVLFFHANGFNARTYRTALAPLAADLRILAVDLRGHGTSPMWSGTADTRTWFDFRDDVLALLPQVTAAPVVLAGHSMGGATALLVAAAAPEMVRGLALFDPVIPSQSVLAAARAGPIPNRSAEGALRRRRHFDSRADAFDRFVGRGIFATWPETVLRDYLEDGLRPRGDGGFELSCAPETEAANFGAFGYDPMAVFASLSTPATILRAARDSTCSVEDAQGLPGATHHSITTIPGTTHFLPMERSALVRETLRTICAA